MSTAATGVMHSIKEKLFHGNEKHTDAEYNDAFTRFTQLHDSLVKLKSSAQNYSNSLYSSLFNSNSASIEFANILEDPLTENGYETISKQMLTAHSTLTSDRQAALTARMSEGVLVPLDKQILNLLNLNTKITKRNELHTNLEYYLGKVAELTKEREERGSKGKSESSSQREKLDRNQTKLNGVRTEYTNFTVPLIAELQVVWQTRAVSLGPILASFASIEKEYLQVYSSALDSVHPEMIGMAPAAGQQVGASSLTQPTYINTAAAATLAPSNPFATPIASSSSSSITTAPTIVAGSGSSSSSNVFGEINDTNANTTAPVANPFEQSAIPAGSGGATFNSLTGAEGAALASGGAPGGLSASQATGTIDAAHSASITKSEHEDESKRQRFESEQKTANIIGV